MKTITWGAGGNYSTLRLAANSLAGIPFTEDTRLLQVGNSNDDSVFGNVIGIYPTAIETNGYTLYITGNKDYTESHLTNTGYYLLYAAADTNVVFENMVVKTEGLVWTSGSSNINITVKKCFIDHYSEYAIMLLSGTNGTVKFNSNDIICNEYNSCAFENTGGVLYFEDIILKAASIDNVFSNNNVNVKRTYLNIEDGATIVENGDLTDEEYETHIYSANTHEELPQLHTGLSFSLGNFKSITPGEINYGVPEIFSVLTADTDLSSNIGHREDYNGRVFYTPGAGCYTYKVASVGAVEMADRISLSDMPSYTSLGADTTSFGNKSSDNSADFAGYLGFGTITPIFGIGGAETFGFGNLTNISNNVTGTSVYGFGDTQSVFDDILNANNTGFGDVPKLGTDLSEPISFLNHVPELGIRINVDTAYGINYLATTLSAEIDYV